MTKGNYYTLTKGREGYALKGDLVKIIELDGATALVETSEGFVFRTMQKHLETPSYQFYVQETQPDLWHVELFLNKSIIERATENHYNATERIFEWALRYDLEPETVIHDGEDRMTLEDFLAEQTSPSR